MKRAAPVGILIAFLTFAALTLAAQSKPPVGTAPQGGTARPLFTSLSTTPPLIVACGTTGATTPLIYYPAAGDTAYSAAFAATGSGIGTLVAGPSTASIPLPCNPCLITAPAPGGPGPIQVSVTITAGACPATNVQMTQLNLKVAP